jgi:hypothetical protein
MCPHGVDPTSPRTEDKKLQLTIEGASAVVGGALLLTFQSYSVEFELRSLTDATDAACMRAFQRFHNLGSLVR